MNDKMKKRRKLSIFLCLLMLISLVDTQRLYAKEGEKSHSNKVSNKVMDEILVQPQEESESLPNTVDKVEGQEEKEADKEEKSSLNEEVQIEGANAGEGDTTASGAITDDGAATAGGAITTAASRATRYFLFNPKTNTITGYSSASAAPKNIVIPEQINGLDVLHIANNAFQGQQLTGVTFNTSKLLTIGNFAFHNNGGILGTITIPNSVTSIGDSAFAGCSKVTSIAIPGSVKSIGASAFSGCSGATSITISSGVTSIGTSAFSGCSSVTSMTIPGSVRSIGDSAFSGCRGITSITISEGVTSIGAQAFENCSRISTITIPDSVTSIGQSAFFGCSALRSILIPTKDESQISGAPWLSNATVYWRDTVVKDGWVFQAKSKTVTKYIGTARDLVMPSEFDFNGTQVRAERFVTETFKGNTSIRSLVISEGITTIPLQGFQSCSNLTSITIPASVTRIDRFAFQNCARLASINIPEGVTSIGESTFQGCSSLASITIPNSVTRIDRFAFQGCTKLTSITIPDGVTRIESNTFGNCTSLTTITIPDNVTRIESNAFYGCTNLARINIQTKNSGDITGSPWGAVKAIVVWQDTVIDGDWVFEGGTKGITNYLGTATSAVMPREFQFDGATVEVEQFSRSTFSENPTIESVVIPDVITSIPDFAFQNCGRLTSVTIPNSVTGIGKSAFANCRNLTGITLPSGVTSIGIAAFSGCTSLITMTIPNGVTRIADSTFAYCEKLTSITIPNSVTSIGSYVFSQCKSLPDITIPNSVISIGSGAFTLCTSLTSITIPNSVTYIAGDAFRSTRLTSISIPTKDSIDIAGAPWGSDVIVQWRDTKVINDWVFQEKSKRIEKYQGNEPNVIMPSQFTVDGNAVQVEAFTASTFSGNTSIESVVVAESITELSQDSFKGCSSLRLITLGSKVAVMHNTALADTTALDTIFVQQGRGGSPIKGNQPWGAANSVKVFYQGEYVGFEHTLEKVEGEYARLIKINASVTGVIQTITLPDGAVEHVGTDSWEGVVKVTQNGTYTFKGVNDAGTEYEYEVEVTDIGTPEIQSADNALVPWPALSSLTKPELVKLAEATGVTETGALLEVNISDQDLDKVKVMQQHGEETSITLSTTNPAPWNKTVDKQITVTLAKIKADVRFEVNHSDLGSVDKTETQEVWVGSPLGEAAAKAELNPYVKNAGFVGWYRVDTTTNGLTYVGDNEKLKEAIADEERVTYRAVFTRAIYEANSVNGPSYGVTVPSYLNIENEKATDASVQLVQLPNETNASGDFAADLKVEVSVNTQNKGYLVSSKDAGDKIAYELYYGDDYNNAGFKLSDGDTVIKKEKADITTFYKRGDGQITVDIPGKVHLKENPSKKGRFMDVLTFELRKIS